VESVPFVLKPCPAAIDDPMQRVRNFVRLLFASTARFADYFKQIFNLVV